MDADQIQELIVQYPQMRDATRMAIVDALRAGVDHKEWGGAIFQRGKRFYATKPQSSGGRANVSIVATADQPGDQGVAIYHTHPRAPQANRFSRQDVDFAKAIKKPSYIGVEGGNVLSFDPAIDRADLIDARRRNDPSAGSAAGQVFLDRKLLTQAILALQTTKTSKVQS